MSFSEHFRQADLSMLSQGACHPLRFVCQIETGPTLTWWLSYSRGIHSPRCRQPDCYTKYNMYVLFGY